MELAAWMSGEFGRGWIGVYTYVWVPLLSTLSITTLLISCTPLQNKKLKKKNSELSNQLSSPPAPATFPNLVISFKILFSKKTF